MALSPLPLLRTIVQRGAALPTAIYGRRQRPWCSGYNMRVSANDDAVLAGVNHPGESTTRVMRLQGAGAAAAATPAAYTVPLASGVSIPQDTDVTTAVVYLNAILLAYAIGDRANAIVVPRFAKSAALPTSGTWGWQVKDADEISVWSNYAAGPLYSDIPAGWQVDLIIPPTATLGGKDDVPVVLKTWTVAGEDTVRVCDFMAVDGDAEAPVVTCNRIFQ